MLTTTAMMVTKTKNGVKNYGENKLGCCFSFKANMNMSTDTKFTFLCLNA